MTAAFPLETLAALPVSGCVCGAGHSPGTCPEDYRRELEPADETIAEVQSVVVAMRHRGDSDDPTVLEDALALYAAQLRAVASTVRDAEQRRVECIRLSAAVAAVAIRYRERIDQE